MISRIIVPLDGSQLAEQAVPTAARIARATHGSLLLLEVVSSVAYVGADFVSPLDTVRLQLQTAQEYLFGLKTREEPKDVQISTRVVEGTTIADDILDIATREHCDLMVLCSHGRTGLLRWAMGSVAENLIHHASIPTLILRSGGPSLALRQGMAGRLPQVLVPLDESALAEAALIPAAHLAAALAAPAPGAIHLLEVLDLTYIGANTSAERVERTQMNRDTRETMRDDAQRYLSGVAKRLGEGELGALGLRVTWSVIEEADVAATLTAVAEGGIHAPDVKAGQGSGPVDLICMATHGRSGLQRWVLGSITERVLHATKLPLLVVRPHLSNENSLGSGWLDITGPAS